MDRLPVKFTYCLGRSSARMWRMNGASLLPFPPASTMPQRTGTRELISSNVFINNPIVLKCATSVPSKRDWLRKDSQSARPYAHESLHILLRSFDVYVDAQDSARTTNLLRFSSTQSQQLIKRSSKRGNTIRLELLSDNIQVNAKLLQAA
jgi:hypothetical protein